MKVIPREARRVTYSTEIRNLKKRLSLSDEQKAIVIGSILGDATLAENWSRTNYRLKIEHSLDQKEYVLWKYSVLRDWFLSGPKYYEKHRSVTVRTISHPALTTLRKIFYKKNRKVIPKDIGAFLQDPRTLAVWFMDDGNAIRIDGAVCGYHLNTQSFTREENVRLIWEFRKKLNILCTLNKNHGRYRLAIRGESEDRFRNLVEHFILPSMRYKIS